MMLYPEPVAEVEIRDIQAVVSDAYGLTIEQLKSDSRDRKITVPRFVAIWLCLQAGHSTTRVGIAFGKSDHTNAIYARKRVALWMQHPEFAKTVSELSSRCGLEAAA